MSTLAKIFAAYVVAFAVLALIIAVLALVLGGFLPWPKNALFVGALSLPLTGPTHSLLWRR